ncbi:cation-translocating P-type ATPase [Vagococcus intermedius]|uniref:P-type Ca(2+) transporter n=1 Tax=Vagococcus intermedius TaxID=2991418 RepID=A0AAF0CUH8_9ENTE|nr:cation-translocating P-type ATPase [Vagococcus intermedius]WEG73233.1 cation-translocating P-type ATPase [Vagococcus intermedius]WEG75318.1 cation-translocating P-type ATPase [Vagococcus intermedius]
MSEHQRRKQLTEAFYKQTEQDVLSKMETSKEGLSQAEAKKRLEEYGHNELDEGKKKSLLSKFIDQFKDFMIMVLLAAALVSYFTGDKVEAIMIIVVVLIMAIFGVVQEAKAEQAIDALKSMATPNARAFRNGTMETVKSTELVPGDIVALEAGDVIPADLRLLEANSLKIEEAALTGESVPVEKEMTVITADGTGIGDRLNMAYMNSNVTYGRGLGVVTGTGMNTEVGKIASMLAQSDETNTPLKENLNSLGKKLTIAILAICVIMFGVGMLKGGNTWIEMLLTSVSLAVAAIPEGLPAIVTIILALGTQKMAKRNALVRKLPAVETLGSTDIICSDKTGTLTVNQMTVEAVFTHNQLQPADEGISADNMTLKVMNFCNDTQFSAEGDLIGDPTETALVKFGLKKEYDVRQHLAEEPRIAELPFDSERKLMTTVHELKDGRFMIATKGAPDELLKRCAFYDVNGQKLSMTEAQKELVLTTNTELAQQALRVLAMAYQIVETRPTEITTETLERNLIFSGLVGMIDPERKEAAQAVKVAKEAGIRPVMITGDHRDTAEAIAVRLGILEEGNHEAVITGSELNNLSDAEFAEKVGQYSVYARVSPEHKVRIVKAWQEEGKVVAMTGDGVNDAPALKTADIGIGMGITGTEVSKGASDMVLADDNFSTIIVAVEEGRKVFSNIQKTIQYLLAANLGEVLTLFIATLVGWDTLLPVHLLWINVVTDTFPAIALGLEPAEKDVMAHKPRGRDSDFFSGGVLSSVIYQGVLEAAITLGVYLFAINYPVHTGYDAIHADALTMSYATLGLIQLFHAFNVKSVHQSLFTVGAFKNKFFNYAILLSFVLLAVTIVVPGFNDLFSVAHLDGFQWAVVFGASISIIPIVEIVKAFQRKNLKSV